MATPRWVAHSSRSMISTSMEIELATSRCRCITFTDFVMKNWSHGLRVL